MADNIEMQGLEFEIVANTEKAEKGLNKLTNTLERLKKALSGVDASDTTAAIKDIDKALNGVDDSKISKLKNTLSKVGSAAQSVKDKISGIGTIPISDGGIGAESVSELTEVSGRVGILTRAFDRLKSSLPELKGAVGKVGNALNNFGKGIVSKVTGLAKQFKRAVFYSLLYNAAYTLINSITKAFQEGFTNMYSYSQAFAGKFSQSMDSLATSTLYLKNSLASAFAPLVNQLAPVIDALMLSEIAKTHKLRYDFVPIDWQLKRIDNFADKLKYCYNYTGEVVRDRFGMSVYSFGNGVPFFAKMLIDDTDTYIAEYENGKFEPAPAVPTAMERLTQLKKDCPEKAEDIKKFIADYEYSLGSELFASRLDEFINSVKEAAKEDN